MSRVCVSRLPSVGERGGAEFATDENKTHLRMHRTSVRVNQHIGHRQLPLVLNDGDELVSSKVLRPLGHEHELADGGGLGSAGGFVADFSPAHYYLSRLGHDRTVVPDEIHGRPGNESFLVSCVVFRERQGKWGVEKGKG